LKDVKVSLLNHIHLENESRKQSWFKAIWMKPGMSTLVFSSLLMFVLIGISFIQNKQSSSEHRLTLQGAPVEIEDIEDEELEFLLYVAEESSHGEGV